MLLSSSFSPRHLTEPALLQEIQALFLFERRQRFMQRALQLVRPDRHGDYIGITVQRSANGPDRLAVALGQPQADAVNQQRVACAGDKGIERLLR